MQSNSADAGSGDFTGGRSNERLEPEVLGRRPKRSEEDREWRKELRAMRLQAKREAKSVRMLEQSAREADVARREREQIQRVRAKSAYEQHLRSEELANDRWRRAEEQMFLDRAESERKRQAWRERQSKEQAARRERLERNKRRREELEQAMVIAAALEDSKGVEVEEEEPGEAHDSDFALYPLQWLQYFVSRQDRRHLVLAMEDMKQDVEEMLDEGRSRWSIGPAMWWLSLTELCPFLFVRATRLLPAGWRYSQSGFEEADAAQHATLMRNATLVGALAAVVCAVCAILEMLSS